MHASASLEELVASHPFLVDLDRQFLNLLIPCACLRRFSSHQCIFEEGGEADHFYLINSGRVGLETAVGEHETLLLQTLGAGDPLGWSWLFPPYKWSCTANILSPTEVLSFTAGFLLERTEEDVGFGNELFKRIGKTMIERIQRMRDKLVVLSRSSLQSEKVGC